MGGEAHRRLRAAVVAVAQAMTSVVAGELAGGEDGDSLASLPELVKYELVKPLPAGMCSASFLPNWPMVGCR